MLHFYGSSELNLSYEEGKEKFPLNSSSEWVLAQGAVFCIKHQKFTKAAKYLKAAKKLAFGDIHKCQSSDVYSELHLPLALGFMNDDAEKYTKKIEQHLKLAKQFNDSLDITPYELQLSILQKKDEESLKDNLNQVSKNPEIQDLVEIGNIVDHDSKKQINIGSSYEETTDQIKLFTNKSSEDHKKATKRYYENKKKELDTKFGIKTDNIDFHSWYINGKIHY